MKYPLKIFFILVAACSLFSCLGPEVSIKPKTAGQIPASGYSIVLVEAEVPHPNFKPPLEEIFRYYLQNAGVTSTNATEIFDPAKMESASYQQERIAHYGIQAILRVHYLHSANRMIYTPTPKGSWAKAWASQDEDRSYTLELIDVQTRQSVWTSEAEVSSIAMLDDEEWDILEDYSKALAEKTVKQLLKAGILRASGKMFNSQL